MAGGHAVQQRAVLQTRRLGHQRTEARQESRDSTHDVTWCAHHGYSGRESLTSVCRLA